MKVFTPRSLLARPEPNPVFAPSADSEIIMNVYLAGPMRDYPEFNFPAFHAAAEELRSFGYHVFSPAERDNDIGFNPAGMKGDHAELEPAGFDLRDALGADLSYICADADAVVVLPGWEKSSGANAEVATAKALGLPVMTLDEAMGRKPAEELESPRAASLRRTMNYVCNDRNASYGPPTQDFERTAALWTAFGFRFVKHPGDEPEPIKSYHIANAQILLKQSRLAWQPEKADSWDDTSGYAACGHECVVSDES